MSASLEDEGQRNAGPGQNKPEENISCDNNSPGTSTAKPSTISSQNKIFLYQDGQLLLSFAPAGSGSNTKGPILLLRGNLAAVSSDSKDQSKLTINLNPTNKINVPGSATSTIVSKPATTTATAVCPADPNSPGLSTAASSFASATVSCSASESSLGAATQQVTEGSDHQKPADGDSIYVCSFKGCGRSFPTMPLLSCHQAIHKTQSPHVAVHKTQSSHLAVQKTHSKKPELVCEVCKLKFAWPSHYKYHLLTHNNERAYKCYFDGCDKRFYTMQRLDVHIRSHTGEKPFECDYDGCEKAFSTKGNLRNHMRIHTGEKPYRCDFEGCTSAFAEFSSLRKHKLIHSGEKPFGCQFCDKVFSQSGSRNIHMNKNHGARRQHALMVNSAQPAVTESAVSATIDSAMVVESQQNILVLTHYDDKMLQYQEHGAEHVVTVSTQGTPGSDHLNLSHTLLNPEETLQTEVEGLANRSNVVVLSQPEELVNMGETYQSATHEEIVYDNDILNSDLDQDQIASTSLSIQQDLENESNESQGSSDQLIVSVLESSTKKKKVPTATLR